MHSLIEAEARYGTKKGRCKRTISSNTRTSPEPERVRARGHIHLTDPTNTSFFADESDHEARWNDGHPWPHRGDAQHLAIQKVEGWRISKTAPTRITPGNRERAGPFAKSSYNYVMTIDIGALSQVRKNLHV